MKKLIFAFLSICTLTITAGEFPGWEDVDLSEEDMNVLRKAKKLLEETEQPEIHQPPFDLEAFDPDKWMKKWEETNPIHERMKGFEGKIECPAFLAMSIDYYNFSLKQRFRWTDTTKVHSLQQNNALSNALEPPLLENSKILLQNSQESIMNSESSMLKDLQQNYFKNQSTLADKLQKSSLMQQMEKTLAPSSNPSVKEGTLLRLGDIGSFPSRSKIYLTQGKSTIKAQKTLEDAFNLCCAITKKNNE